MYLKFPSKLCNIGDRAFAGCEKLIAILLLPTSITTIWETIFWDGSNDKVVNDKVVNDKVVFFENNTQYDSLEYQFIGCIRVLIGKKVNS